MLICIFNFI